MLTLATAAVARAPYNIEAIQAFGTASALMRETIGEARSRTAHAAATLWQAQGERCTTWHFQLVGRPDAPPAVASLRGNDGSLVHMHQVQSGADFQNIVDAHYSSDSPTSLFRVGTTGITHVLHSPHTHGPHQGTSAV
jgi:hypothetical protein